MSMTGYLGCKAKYGRIVLRNASSLLGTPPPFVRGAQHLLRHHACLLFARAHQPCILRGAAGVSSSLQCFCIFFSFTEQKTVFSILSAYQKEVKRGFDLAVLELSRSLTGKQAAGVACLPTKPVSTRAGQAWGFLFTFQSSTYKI
jgi:hypothetical protein